MLVYQSPILHSQVVSSAKGVDVSEVARKYQGWILLLFLCCRLICYCFYVAI